MLNKEQWSFLMSSGHIETILSYFNEKELTEVRLYKASLIPDKGQINLLAKSNSEPDAYRTFRLQQRLNELFQREDIHIMVEEETDPDLKPFLSDEIIPFTSESLHDYYTKHYSPLVKVDMTETTEEIQFTMIVTLKKNPEQAYNAETIKTQLSDFGQALTVSSPKIQSVKAH